MLNSPSAAPFCRHPVIVTSFPFCSSALPLLSVWLSTLVTGADRKAHMIRAERDTNTFALKTNMKTPPYLSRFLLCADAVLHPLKRPMESRLVTQRPGKLPPVTKANTKPNIKEAVQTLPGRPATASAHSNTESTLPGRKILHGSFGVPRQFTCEHASNRHLA